MLTKFLHGLAFGAGFAIAAIAVMLVYRVAGSWWLTSRAGDEPREVLEPAAEIASPPAISPTRFLGSTAMYSADFVGFRSGTVLATGPGRIVGRVTSNGTGVGGLKLRLALNGSAVSAWATTDAQGDYTVSVPFGRYRVDGYDLDYPSANRVLAGRIDVPRMSFASGKVEFDVAPDSPGEGPTLRYVDPVVVLGPTGTASLSQNIVVRWEPYPGAASYRVQLHRAATAYEYPSDAVFDIRNRPEVQGTSYDLTANGVLLQSGQHYSIEIEARDGEGRPLAGNSNGPSRESSFRVVD
jgi:hypothetical protein